MFKAGYNFVRPWQLVTLLLLWTAALHTSTLRGQDWVRPPARLNAEEDGPTFRLLASSEEVFQEGTSQPTVPAATIPVTDPMTESTTIPGESTNTYGEEPAPVSDERLFLRTQTVLLAPGQWQFDYGFSYSLFQINLPSVHNGNIVRTDLDRRTLFVPFAFRYGWNSRTQLFINAPVGYRHNSLATNPISDPSPIDLNSDRGGIGDIQLGGSYLWRQGGDGVPDIVLSAIGTLPTGEGVLPISILGGGLGNGLGALGGTILFVHTYDPVVVYWGAGYRHYFERNFQGVNVQLGEEFTYQLGAGFAANERVTLSAGFLGAFVTETKFNNVGIPGTTQEPMRMRFSVTANRNCRIVEPFAEIGMTFRAPAARIGVTWTY